MCSTMLPLRLVVRLKPGEFTSSFRYLTCSEFHHRRRQPQESQSRERIAFNSVRFPQQHFLLSCAFSTVRKNNEIDKNLIPEVGLRNERQSGEPANQQDIDGDAQIGKKLGLFARFRLMYKQYWYVLIPVHVVTSIGWLGGFYYLSSSGVDIPSILETINISDTIIEKLKGSSMGHVAIAYLCYKIATPVRYMVTLGGTTVSIKYLEQYGYIKPMPSKSQLIQMYEDKKADRAKRKQDKLDSEQSKDDEK